MLLCILLLLPAFSACGRGSPAQTQAQTTGLSGQGGGEVQTHLPDPTLTVGIREKSSMADYMTNDYTAQFGS